MPLLKVSLELVKFYRVIIEATAYFIKLLPRSLWHRVHDRIRPVAEQCRRYSGQLYDEWYAGTGHGHYCRNRLRSEEAERPEALSELC